MRSSRGVTLRALSASAARGVDIEFSACPFCSRQHGEAVFKCPDTDMALPLTGRLLSDKFRFIRTLGKGGMASVWLALNTSVDREVAIKIIRPEVLKSEDLVARFRSEAKAAGRIAHPNICDILDFGVGPVGPYIVMEYLRGRNLAEMIQERGSLDPSTAVSLVLQALDGLQAAHARGIVHRDLKPENVFVHRPRAGAPAVKLMDFGVAKFTDGSAEITTEHGALLGTPEYMAPEQFRGADQAEPRTDIWAVGAILYRALTGRHPFKGPTVAATLLMVTHDDPVSIHAMRDDVPDALEAVVSRCLSKAVEDRFADVPALREALLGASEDKHEDTSSALIPLLDLDDTPPPVSTPPAPAELQSTPGASASAPLPGGSSGPPPPDLSDAFPLPGGTEVHPADTPTRILSEAAPPVRSEAEPEPEPEDDPADDRTTAAYRTTDSGSGFGKLLFGFAAVVGIAIVGFALWPSDPPSPSPIAASSAPPAQPPAPSTPPPIDAAPPPVAEVEAPEAGLDDPPSAIDEPDVPAAIDDAADSNVEADDADEIEIVDGDEPPGSQPAAAPVPPAPSPRSTATPEPVELPAGVVDVGGGYVMAIKRGGRSDHGQARKFCEALGATQHAGLRGWKLPFPGLVKKMQGSRALHSGRYWTSARWHGNVTTFTMPTGELRKGVNAERRAARTVCVTKFP